MKKITVLGADWCPVTTETRRFWEELQERYDFEYEYIKIDTEEGKGLVQRHSVTSVPKTFVGGRIVFDGIPDRNGAEELVK